MADFSLLCAQRHSVRSYDKTRPVDRALLERIMHAAQTGPTAGNLQAWRAHVIDCCKQPESVRQRLYGAQWFLDVPYAIIFCALRRDSAAKYKSRGRELYSVQDATIAATLAMMEATSLGLGTCWLGAFSDTYAAEILGIGSTSDEDPIILLTVGYEKVLPDSYESASALAPRPKPRKHKDDVIFH